MKQFIACVLALTVLGACKKEKEATPSTMELLTSKPWLLTSARTVSVSTNSAGASHQTNYNDYALLPSCQQDNTYKFNVDNTLTTEEGQTKCFSYDPQTTSRQWNFNRDQTELTVPPFHPVFGYGGNRIVELTASTMRLHRTEIDTLNDVILKKESDLLFSAKQ